MSATLGPLVVKVGGSLYDLDDLKLRLAGWLERQTADEVIIVPGGGALVETIRHWDQMHHLGEEACHWLALRTLAVNARFLAQLLLAANIIDYVGQRRPGVSILDGYAFASADEARPGKLPHSWAVTGDSLAVRVAILAKARELVLLKSVDLPAGIGWPQAASMGVVDEYFCQVLPADLAVRVVNLRSSA